MVDISFVGLSHSVASATWLLTDSIFLAILLIFITSTVNVASNATITIDNKITVIVKSTIIVVDSPINIIILTISNNNVIFLTSIVVKLTSNYGVNRFISRGNNVASLTLFRPIVFSTSRSMPKPQPPCCGRPYLNACK